MRPHAHWFIDKLHERKKWRKKIYIDNNNKGEEEKELINFFFKQLISCVECACNSMDRWLKTFFGCMCKLSAALMKLHFTNVWQLIERPCEARIANPVCHLSTPIPKKRPPNLRIKPQPHITPCSPVARWTISSSGCQKQFGKSRLFVCRVTVD